MSKQVLIPPAATKTVLDFSSLLQDPDVTEVTTPPTPPTLPAEVPVAEDDDPTIRLSVSVTKSFAVKLQRLADTVQGSKPGRGNVSLLLRTLVIQSYGDWFIEPTTQRTP